MTAAGTYPASQSERWNTVLAGCLGALIAFAGLLALATWRNAGVFEYPLDDPYIHMAMADGIARGEYGVNVGEIASAASSPLYPFLFVPFSGTDAQVWIPFLVNVAALLAAAALFGRVLALADLGRFGVWAALLAPAALAMVVVGFTGMENLPHGAASLAIVVGLWRFIETRQIGWLLIAGVAVAPALRLEGLALGLSAAGVVFLLGRRLAGAGLAFLTVLPVAAFAAGLVSLGLDPLPASVTAKLDTTGGDTPLATLLANQARPGGRFVLALCFALLLVALRTRKPAPDKALFGLAVAASGLAHLAFGGTGWMDRYENYALLAVSAALILLLAPFGQRLKGAAVTAIIGCGFLIYAPNALTAYAWNPAALTNQQAQMARFAKEYVRAPVAVNDLGHVVWRNPNYVLDLWGLASKEAFELRSGTPGAGWAGPLAETHGVEVVMIYDAWLPDAVPEDWRRLGTLVLDVPRALIGGGEVAFYATSGDEVTRLSRLLAEWETDLPPRARFLTAEGAVE